VGFEIVFGVSLIVLALYSWFRITDTFYKKLKQGWQMMPMEEVTLEGQALLTAKPK
jgi:hypothetical protein